MSIDRKLLFQGFILGRRSGPGLRGCKDGNHGESIAMKPEMIGEVFDFFNQHSKSNQIGSADDSSSAEAFREFSNKTGKKVSARILSVAGRQVTIVRKGGG